MERFSALLALWAGIHWSPVNSHYNGQWCEALMFSLICAWTNGWINNRDAGDFICHHAHYDVIVMYSQSAVRTLWTFCVMLSGRIKLHKIIDSQWNSTGYVYNLTHWGRVTHRCVSKLTFIGSDNGLSLGRHQALIRTNAGILLIWPLGTNFSEISIVINIYLLKKMRLKTSSGKWPPSCLGINVLIMITVPTDGLAPVGVKPSVGTVMSKFESYTYMRSVLQKRIIVTRAPFANMDLL